MTGSSNWTTSTTVPSSLLFVLLLLVRRNSAYDVKVFNILPLLLANGVEELETVSAAAAAAAGVAEVEVSVMEDDDLSFCFCFILDSHGHSGHPQKFNGRYVGRSGSGRWSLLGSICGGNEENSVDFFSFVRSFVFFCSVQQVYGMGYTPPRDRFCIG